MDDAATDSLATALERHQIDLPKDQIKQIDHYAKLLWDWNTKINLTRHTDYDKFVGRDVRDTVELSKLLHPDEEVLDVGTGGGVPGVILSIIRPDLKVVLSESIGKKANAVETMLRKLKLPTPLYNARANTLFDDLRFDAVFARAVGPLAKLLPWFADDWASVGRLLAIKGPNWTDERLEAREKGLLNKVNLRVASTYPLYGTESESVILKVWPKTAPEK